MNNEFLSAVANYISTAISDITELDKERSVKVAMAILNSRDDEDGELPLPSVMLMDLVSEETIKRNEFSEDADVKRFIDIWKERNSKQLV